MSALYSRILLWHKLVAMRTGALALCSAKRALNRDEARSWIEGFRNVADDVESFLDTETFILDDRGQRVVGLGQVAALEGTPETAPRRLNDDVRTADGVRRPAPKNGGPRVAKRK